MKQGRRHGFLQGILLVSMLTFLGRPVLAGTTEIFDELDAAKLRWNENGLKNYKYTIRSCGVFGCSKPIHIVVRNSTCEKAYSGFWPFQKSEDCTGRTIDFMLHEIEELIRDPTTVSVEAKFDPKLGYPTELWADPTREFEDSEFGYYVSKFSM